MSDVVLAGGHLFLDRASVQRMAEVPPTRPSLGLGVPLPESTPDLRARAEGYDDFIVERASEVTAWEPDVVDFARRSDFQVVSDWDRPASQSAGFFRVGGTQPSLGELSRRWRANGDARYRFDVERFCFCGPRVLAARITVANGFISGAQTIPGPGEPAVDLDWSQFWSIEGLFADLEARRGETDLFLLRFDPERGFPNWVCRNPALGFFDVDVTYRISNVVRLD